jgi:hypothetical protein
MMLSPARDSNERELGETTMKLLSILPAIALVLGGCSKPETPASEAAATSETDPAAVDPAAAEAAVEQPAAAPALEMAPVEVFVDNVQFSQDLNAIPDILKNQEYDAAVASLVLMKQLPKNPEQERAYIRRLEEAAAYLQEQAARDPRAAGARQNLGRGVTGR